MRFAITLETLREDDCGFIISTQHSFGLHSIGSFDKNFLCSDIKRHVTPKNSKEYRPASGLCQNRLDVSLSYSGEFYLLNFQVRANGEKNCTEINRLFDEAARKRYFP